MNARMWTRRVLAFLSCVCLAFAMLVAMMFGTQAHAADSGSGSVTVTYTYKGDGNATPLAGVSMKLYRVADWSKTGGYAATSDFKNYSIDWDALFATDGETVGDQTLREFAMTIATYAERDGLTAAQQAITDTTGVAAFDGLADGLYLVATGQYTKDADNTAGTSGMTCETTAMLVALPDLSKDEGEQRTLSIEPKPGCTVVPATEERTVKKVWKGDDKKRPTSVTVQLLKDGESYDEIDLTASNNWSHTWSGLETGHNWTVVEKSVPSGYTMLMNREGTTFIITNTKKPTTPDTGSSIVWVAVGLGVFLVVGAGLLIFQRSRRGE